LKGVSVRVEEYQFSMMRDCRKEKVQRELTQRY
jgi:hypothetical protein